MKPKRLPRRGVVIVNGDDWSGMYVDGKLVHESSYFSDLVIQLCKHFKVTIVEPDEDWLEGGLPCGIGDLKITAQHSK